MTSPSLFEELKGADWLFSLKTFLAAMLALYVAFAFDLPRPAWAMGTVYLVSQPLAGQVVSKSFFRVLGTLLGAAVALISVPTLQSAPELLIVVLAGWCGLCLYISLLDRTPRSYVFMLAGYTASIIGFSSIDAPVHIFDVTVARCEEIVIGIVCGTMVNGLLFARHIGPLLAKRIDNWFLMLNDLAAHSLEGPVDGQDLKRERSKLAREVADSYGQVTHLYYEQSEYHTLRHYIRILHHRIVLQLPLLFSLGQAFTSVTEKGETNNEPAQADLLAIRERTHEAMHGTMREQSEAMRKLYTDITRLQAQEGPIKDLNGLVRKNLLARLHRFLDHFLASITLWMNARSGHGMGSLRGSNAYPLHRDHGAAFRSALGAFFSVIICSVFAIATTWPGGSVAAQMAALGASIGALGENPTSAILTFARATIASTIAAFIILFGLMPQIDGFPLLALCFFPFLMLFGALVSIPRVSVFGVLSGLLTGILVSPQSRYQADLAEFANSAAAMLLAFTITPAVVSLIRIFSVEKTAQRLLAAGWTEIAAVSHNRWIANEPLFAYRMMDRLGLLARRLNAYGNAIPEWIAPTQETALGMDVLELRRLEPLLPPAAGRRLAAMREDIATLFVHKAHSLNGAAPQTDFDHLLNDLDASLHEVFACPLSDRRDEALIALYGIRRILFPSQPMPELHLPNPALASTPPTTPAPHATTTPALTWKQAV
ncbi:FUSC family protein [Beijerinckia indica]|uniref:Fusaric acid resistance protein conserved region n=1 Tax=Beijerinckia indica subsp. indica (strain ATCC 9039 / DSM 1715 / NCIMB 8712) TaxID=395963 RepID=B2IHE8_BEII9|nr:FUSC family protein [Beijerinckia indica]ACB95933.1 Fusaric acid resistance protein conserved region [Beijerinckia indica subsp. indica ATCC 9039]